MNNIKLTKGTNSSTVVSNCQTCNYSNLESIIFLGYLPPVNKVVKSGVQPYEQPSYPAELLYCPKCHLVQLGLIVDPNILFPSEYPYTSSTTKILRDNFAELYMDCREYIQIKASELVIDIGSNDGNLLDNFKGKHRVLGVTPEEIGKLAIEKGIPTIISYFTKEIAQKIINEHGKAKIVTATNVFAHMDNIHQIIDSIVDLLDNKGVFISESHYLLSLIDTLQYDTIYHEHMRYYSLHSLKYLLEMHNLEIFKASKIPTHGGSVRVYAARKNDYVVSESVNELLNEEKEKIISKERLLDFKHKVVLSKLNLQNLLYDIKKNGQTIYGISAPSRGSTLFNYIGLDDGIIDYIVEIKGSYKIGNYLPGTLIPIVEESKLFEEQPDYALFLSWHIADELAPKLRKKGFRGDFIVPLPKPYILKI